ncbi:forkhead box protein L2-like [Impatiens glandulifera]|uniref:forkhead box protein L2-like n=1 Tax=Impatiens glandulifera TaxID=253017 RepID=UPI001FB0D516|nr:forkhead box protein L2-like [Impatiens glandulifera]
MANHSQSAFILMILAMLVAIVMSDHGPSPAPSPFNDYRGPSLAPSSFHDHRGPSLAPSPFHDHQHQPSPAPPPSHSHAHIPPLPHKHTAHSPALTPTSAPAQSIGTPHFYPSLLLSTLFACIGLICFFFF